MLRHLIAILAVLAFSLHGVAMAALVDHSCNAQELHGGTHADKATSPDAHSSPESFTPCCASACTLLSMPSPAFSGTPASVRVSVQADPVRTGIQPEGPRRPPRPAGF